MQKKQAESFAVRIEADEVAQYTEEVERCEILAVAVVGESQKEQFRLHAAAARAEANHWQEFANFVRESAN